MTRDDTFAKLEPAQFRQNVVEIVALIPDGRVLSYGDVATLAGSTRAARAVGTILKSIGDALPWHRVVNRDLCVSGSNFDGRPLHQVQRLQGEGHTVGHQGCLQDRSTRWPLEEAFDAWGASKARD